MGPRKKAEPRCSHGSLSLKQPSDHATEVGYTIPSGLDSAKTWNGTFPAPLILPGDELAFDPTYEAQSLQHWMEEEYRNEVTAARRTIYIVPPPAVNVEVSFVKEWSKPQESSDSPGTDAETPRFNDIVSYLSAFYHPLPVKLLTKPGLELTTHSRPSSKKARRSNSTTIGLNMPGQGVIDIRARRSKDDIFSHQLNLDNLLDAAIFLLPSDAYAVLLLTHHDLYEDEEDDFCCGRAYGGSRVAVVSTARYNPSLDACQDVELEHAWPASHCQHYVDLKVRGAKPPRKRRRCPKTIEVPKAPMADWDGRSGLYQAVKSLRSLPLPSTPEEMSHLWLGRVCKTAAHELGHCFGMDHCESPHHLRARCCTAALL